MIAGSWPVKHKLFGCCHQGHVWQRAILVQASLSDAQHKGSQETDKLVISIRACLISRPWLFLLLLFFILDHGCLSIKSKILNNINLVMQQPYSSPGLFLPPGLWVCHSTLQKCPPFASSFLSMQNSTHSSRSMFVLISSTLRNFLLPMNYHAKSISHSSIFNPT